MRVTESDKRRFWAKVDKSGECWEWTAGHNPNGRPSFWLNGKNHLAHRVSAAIAGMDLSSGLLVCHTCDNINCVKPAHLFSGSNADNQIDSVQKNRHWKQKVTIDDVIEIRRRHQSGIRQVELASEYGVKQSTIHYIVSAKQWKHVPQEGAC